jgi:hypothetical protein
MARLAPFYPAMLAFVGALLVAAGGFWASYRQSNFNSEIKVKNEEIARLQIENANTLTGGDSFAYMALSIPDPATSAIAVPVFIHKGKYPLYDVTARVVDIDAIARAKHQVPYDQTPLLGTTLRIGNMTPSFAFSGVGSLSHFGRDFNYNVFFVARNGSWTQQLRMHWTGNGWATANQVEWFGRDGKPFVEISEDYPRNANGEIDWNEKAELREDAKGSTATPQGDGH